MTIELAVVVGAYLLGSIPFGYLVVRLLSGKDVRRAGSQNVGATNALRTAGWGAGLLVFVLDVGKGVVPVLLMGAINPATRWVGAAAAAAVIGHCYPVWLKFKGGKGISTAAGAFAVLSPLSAACAGGVWLVVLAARQLVSLASMVAVASLPVFLYFVGGAHLHLVASGALVAAVCLLRHWSNLRRMVEGTEPTVTDWARGEVDEE